MTVKRIAPVLVAFAAAAVFAFSVVLNSGKGGTWALPAFVMFSAVLVLVGLALLVRTLRAHKRSR